MDKLFSDYDKARIREIGVMLEKRYGETMWLTDICRETNRYIGSLSKRLDKLGFAALRDGKKYKTWIATVIIYAILEGWGTRGEMDVRMHELRSAISRAKRASGAARVLGQR